MYQLRKILILSYFLLIIICDTFAQSNNQCERFKWKCKNGQCIDMDALCDGNLDCQDNSDETAESCVHNRCPDYAFRCAYGACVSGDAECNGIKDCVDNSDETSIVCPGVVQAIKINGNCSDDQLQCSTGSCIPIDNACDGKAHCLDGSDETVKLCANSYCPEFAFRCGYGACISGAAKCDGVKDCYDGSDESPVLCGQGHTTQIYTEIGKDTTPAPSRPRPTPTPTRTPTRTTSTTEISRVSRCMIGHNRPKLIYVYDSNHNEVINPGTYVENSASITYKCQPKYFLTEQLTNFCIDGEWLSEHPSCIKYCSNVAISGITIQPTCEYNGARVPCNQPLRVGTRAIITCQIGYSKPDRVVQEVLVCADDGEWDYHPFRCEQVCGQEPVQARPFLIGADRINNTLVPWHVSIFAQKSTRYEQICAGTIINAKVVLSAAHCFWDVRYEKPHDKSLFVIGAGKYYRDYNAQEPLTTQFLKIAELHIPNGYKDVLLSYQSDIAVIIVNEFIVFKTYVKPICIEWQNYSNRSVKSNLYGRVAGWGKTEDSNPSNELRVADLPTISYDECIEKTEPKYRVLVTGDKFCVGTDSGQSVCEGDSGGGFALPKTVGGVKTYFLWGIVSNGLTSKQECSGSYFTTFTNIQYHSAMIIEYESKNRPK